MSLLAEVFWQTGLPPWEVMSLPLLQRSFVIAVAAWKQRQQRAEAGADEIDTVEDQMDQVQAFAARHPGAVDMDHYRGGSDVAERGRG